MAGEGFQRSEACPDLGDWQLDTPEPETDACTVTGDEDACDIAYRVRFRHARHSWPYPVITILTYAAFYKDDDGWEAFIVRVKTEWIVCDDPDQPEATSLFGAAGLDGDPEFYDDPADADQVAREMAADIAAGTEDYILGCALEWNGRDGLP